MQTIEHNHPFLSIIIPAHNEEHRLPGSLERIDAFLQTQPYRSEIIVVENGSTDHTLQVAEAWAARRPRVRVLHDPMPGKGRSVRHGMLAARGEFRFMCDADLSMPIEQIDRFLPPALADYDVAIGSREVSGARRIGEPVYRHLVGRAFSLLVRLLVVKDFQDTQCGFKCFRAGAAAELFAVQRLDGYAFDVEVLFLAQKHGYKVVEVPIDWHYATTSQVRLFRDVLRMLRELKEIQANWKTGRY